MTERQILLVKRSWQIIGKIDPVLVGDVFYSKLFLEAPELRSMFKADRKEQSKKLIGMLTVIVAGLDRLEEFKDDIRQLAIRHRKYGVANWHFEKVGSALLWTLSHGLGPDFDKETEEAWIDCYTLLSKAMMEAITVKSYEL